jgi:DNA-binding XRE family transcriptional regulator
VVQKDAKGQTVALMASRLTDKEFEKLFKRLGQRVRKLRMDRGMVQEDMLSHGFSTRHYQRIEAGLPINLKTAYRLCKVFGVSFSELFEGLE